MVMVSMSASTGSLQRPDALRALRPTDVHHGWMPFKREPRDQSARAARVAFFLLPGFGMLSYAAATECLQAVNQTAGEQLYEWFNVSPDGDAAYASNGNALQCESDVRGAEAFDYVFVCASACYARSTASRSRTILRSGFCTPTSARGPPAAPRDHLRLRVQEPKRFLEGLSRRVWRFAATGSR
jgi:hypothetical protein